MPLMRYMFEKFQYYEKPEGQDPVGKIVGFANYGIITGTFCALYDACLYSHCTNTVQFLNTAGWWLVPTTGMCVAFSSVTYAACKLRKKDDKVNYVLGALAAGSVLHWWQPKPIISGWGTFFMVLLAVFKKDQVDGNYTTKNIFVPDKLPRRWLLSWRHLDSRNYHGEPFRPFNRLDYYTNYKYKIE